MNKFKLVRSSIMVIVICVVWFALVGNSSARGFGPIVRSQGSITSVDCNGSSFVLSDQAGSQIFFATQFTAIYAGTERLSEVCTLQHFVGSMALVWSTPVGAQQIVGRIDLSVFNGQGVVAGDRGGEGSKIARNNGSTEKNDTLASNPDSTASNDNSTGGNGGSSASGGTGSAGGGSGSGSGSGGKGGSGSGGSGSGGSGGHGHGEGGASGHSDNNPEGKGNHERGDHPGQEGQGAGGHSH